MVSEILAVVTLHRKDGIPADDVQNAFAWTGASVPMSSAEADDIVNSIDNFYNANGSLGSPITHYMSEALVSGSLAADLDYYDLTGHLDGTPHGSPILSRHFTLTAPPDSSPLPSEVCACISYHASMVGDLEVVGATRPRARDRGRIYLGPLNVNAIQEESTTHESLITANCRQTLADGANQLMVTPTNVTWCLWSRKAAALKPVLGGYVDNAFDVQRRRGQQATARTAFP